VLLSVFLPRSVMRVFIETLLRETRIPQTRNCHQRYTAGMWRNVVLLLCLFPALCREVRTASPATDISLLVLQREYAATRAARDNHNKALHLYRLNDVADRYAYHLNHQGGLHPDKVGDRSEVQRANQHGAAIDWCVYDADWKAGPQGYLSYLSLSPDGPDAEEAWWCGKLGRKLNRCFDAVGSEEEAADFVQEYREFLLHFPHGKHQREAQRLLKQWQTDLDSYRQQKSR